MVDSITLDDGQADVCVSTFGDAITKGGGSRKKENSRFSGARDVIKLESGKRKREKGK